MGERTSEVFGRDDRAGLLVVSSDRPRDRDAFAVLDALTRRLEARDDLSHVISPTAARIAVRSPDGNVRLERRRSGRS